MSDIKINDLNKNKLYPDFLIKEVNNSLRYYIKKYKRIPGILRDAVEYSIENSGKRFRPILCLLTAKSTGKDYHTFLPTACAIEFIHTYSLIHDDLPSMDNDDFRRGKPTCHKKFSEDIAILTGDALFAEAFNLIIKYQKADTGAKIRVLEEIAGASGIEGMVAGQVMDVYYTGKKMSSKELECMDHNKTGKLITASARCAAILCGTSEDYLRKFTEYAENLGLAFQITDDILDVETENLTEENKAGKIIIKKKNTYPEMWGISRSKEIAADKINKAIAIVKSMDIDYEWLVNIANFLLVRKA
ncbi:MAG TPA: farnesyl diphosphate synthase [Candidatus Humimicrobiaceae bacterium]|nr:farnesyl diphosphate synthase [Candidatus Humimicrobiaceae bacterium]